MHFSGTSGEMFSVGIKTVNHICTLSGLISSWCTEDLYNLLVHQINLGKFLGFHRQTLVDLLVTVLCVTALNCCSVSSGLAEEG